MNTSSNISDLLPKDLANKVGGKDIKNFGLQSIPKPAALGQITNIKQKLSDLVKQQSDLATEYTTNKTKLEADYKSNQLTKEQYDIKTKTLDENYILNSNSLNIQISDLNEQLSQQILGPYNELNTQQLQLKASLTSANSTMSKEEVQAKKDKALKSLKNAAKSLVISLSVPLINELIALVIGNNKLKKLVRETNKIIDAANTKSALQQAKIKRDSAYNLLNNLYNKVKKIKDVLQRIEIAITILSLIISIIKLLPAVKTNPALQSQIDKYKAIIDALALVLGIIIVSLQRELMIILDLEAQLHALGTILESNTIKSPDFQAILDDLQTTNEQNFGDYKGFKFAIKEDNTPGYNIKGNKRHYAVALDRYDVAVLKSDMSFTTDYQVLIDQLKIVIDQQNLQG
jgi:hypothetical protein